MINKGKTSYKYSAGAFTERPFHSIMDLLRMSRLSEGSSL